MNHNTIGSEKYLKGALNYSIASSFTASQFVNLFFSNPQIFHNLTFGQKYQNLVQGLVVSQLIITSPFCTTSDLSLWHSVTTLHHLLPVFFGELVFATQ